MADEDAATQAAGYPPYVTTDEDRTRWDNAGTVARINLGEQATDEAVWSMRRAIYHDRESYPS